MLRMSACESAPHNHHKEPGFCIGKLTLEVELGDEEEEEDEDDDEAVVV